MHVSRCIGVAVLVAVFMIVSGQGGARAASQAGGLPAVSDRVSVLERIAATLQTAVASLQTQVTTLKTHVTTLQTQVTTLETANTGLQNALNAETAARIAADNALQAALNQEATTRKAQDDNLVSALLNEGLRRISADAELRGLINNARGQAFSTFRRNAQLVNGATALVGAVGPLPAGNYLVTAKATVSNSDDDASWDCFLQRDDKVAIDSTGAGTSSDSHFATIVNVGLTSLPSAQSIKMFCGTFGGIAGSQLFDIAMTAVQVGDATIACPDLTFRCPGE
jgi:regulator of replication initiation timing